MFFSHPDLPIKSDRPEESFFQPYFHDANHALDEILDKIKIRDEMKVVIKKTIPVEHSHIDFQFMIMANKLDYDSKEKKPYVFDDLKLAELMVQNSETNVQFYQSDAIQKIIDFQFVTTKMFFERLAIIYLVLFMIPLLVIIFYDDVMIDRICYIICYFTQLWFFAIEIIQMRAVRWDYISQFNNYNDSLQFLIFLMLMTN